MTENTSRAAYGPRRIGVAVTLLTIGATALSAQTGPGIMNHYPTWAPDGAGILFDSNRDGDSEIYFMALDGTNIRQLTDNDASDWIARWSSDGSHIVFSSDRNGTWERFTMDPDGTNQRVLDAALDSVVSRSDDGAVVLFRTSHMNEETLVSQVGDGTIYRLPTSTQDQQHALSPSGAWVILERWSGPLHGFDEPEADIVLMTVRGDDERAVAPGTDPSWAPDGSRILFKTWVTDEKRWHVATVRPDGSELRQLTAGTLPTWSPDGRLIAYMTETADGGSHIWVMTETGADQRCLTCGHQ